VPLEVVVFVVGSASLGAEIAAARLLAPYFGASTIVWANTIATVLVALAVGYWIGGKMADRRPHPRGLSLVVVCASVLLAVVPFVGRPFLSESVKALDSISAEAPDVALIDRELSELTAEQVLNAVGRDGIGTRILLIAADPEPFLP